MQISTRILFITIIVLTVISCTKSKDSFPAASLNVVNASPGVADAKVHTPNADGYYSQLTGVAYSTNFVFTVSAGTSPITIASGDDTTKPLYTTSIKTNAGDIYSLFIGGASGNDFVLNKDTIPYYADSTMGVRFIDMSYNSTAVNLALVASPAQNEFSGIAYKSITGFKTYGTKITDPATYTFQVTDGSGTIIATSPDIASGTLIGKNITLVLEGATDGTGATAPQVFIVNNF